MEIGFDRCVRKAMIETIDSRSRNTSAHLAFDLGAGSGRGVVGRFDGERLQMEEVLRFPNGPVRVGGRLHWDVLRLVSDVLDGIRAARAAGLGDIESLAIDSWGCDFGLLDAQGELIGNPLHYRDRKHLGAMEQVLGIVPREEIYARTGIQFLPLNTLFQLYALKMHGSSMLERAKTMLLIPDLIRYCLTGEMTSEHTIASTTQMLSIHTGDWDRELVEKAGLPASLLTPIVPPASHGGTLLPEVASDLGVRRLPVIAVASHDTASAVLATPAAGPFAYISSGTWSLQGTELDRPIVDCQALARNFTNEGGAQGTFRFLKNITGLWLVESCRRVWEREGQWPGHDVMAQETLAAPALRSFINPDDLRFLNPIDLPAEVAAFCAESGQAVPESRGEIMRVILESLAFSYRQVLEWTEALTGERYGGIHVVGGGTKNRVLQQFTANAIGRPVWAGPTEATAIGNVLGQLTAQARIGGLSEGRELVRRSFPIETFEPAGTEDWAEAYPRFLLVRG
jgi:rhamnulokinase